MAHTEWSNLTIRLREAIAFSWRSGMPVAATALYNRWWQLETWLRSLVYVELRSERGGDWATALPKPSADRQERDSQYHHMLTPDSQDQLAYLDAADLLQLTHDNWHLFKPYLPKQAIWLGRIEELKAIRNRIGHCRRPHSDDLDRLEQTLRDLDAGAFLASSSFNNQWRPEKAWRDALIQGWVNRAHEAAGRLVDHAQNQYDTTFQLRLSRRKWAETITPEAVELGQRPGYIWHACWYFRGGRTFDLARFWRDIEHHHQTVLLVCACNPSSLEVSFSALEDQNLICDAIGDCFDAALFRLGSRATSNYYDSWTHSFSNLDPRVHTHSPWADVHPSMDGIGIFGA